MVEGPFLDDDGGSIGIPRLYTNPKEIEDLLHIMNETKVEFTIPDAGDGSDGYPPWKEIGCVPTEKGHVPGKGDTCADKN
jgi:hypothetical protein